MKSRVILFEETIYHQHRFVVEYKDEDEFERKFEKLENELDKCSCFDDVYSVMLDNFKVREVDEDYSTDSGGIEYQDDYEFSCEYQRYGD